MCDKNGAVNPNCSAADFAPAIENSATMTNTELLEAIDEILGTSKVADIDMQLVNHYMDVLNQRAPLNMSFDSKSAWGKLDAHYPNITKVDEPETQTVVSFKQPKTSRPRKTFLRIFEVAVLLMMFATITVSAFGFSPFQAIVEWIEDIIQVYSNPSGSLELPENAPSIYLSLREALDANGAENALAPTWIPAEYDVSGVSVKSAGTITKFTAIYSSEHDSLMISVTLANGVGGVSVVEREEDFQATFVVDSYEWYISYNADRITARCYIGEHTYAIAGDITQAELETVIKSMKKG